MHEGEHLPAVVGHGLAHLAEHSAHVDRRADAVDDGAALHGVAEALDLAVGAGRARPDATVLFHLDLHLDLLRVVLL